MCGIIGYFNVKEAPSKVLAGLKTMQERGKDGSGIATEEDIDIQKSLKKLKAKSTTWAIGHNLHSVVDFLPQPLQEKEAIFAANCEIYN